MGSGCKRPQLVKLSLYLGPQTRGKILELPSSPKPSVLHRKEVVRNNGQHVYYRQCCGSRMDVHLQKYVEVPHMGKKVEVRQKKLYEQ